MHSIKIAVMTLALLSQPAMEAEAKKTSYSCLATKTAKSSKPLRAPANKSNELAESILALFLFPVILSAAVEERQKAAFLLR